MSGCKERRLDTFQMPAGAFSHPLRLSTFCQQTTHCHDLICTNKGAKWPRPAPPGISQTRNQKVSKWSWDHPNIIIYFFYELGCSKGSRKALRVMSRSIARQRSDFASEGSIGPCLRPPFKEIPTFSSCEKSVRQEISIIGDNNRHHLYKKLPLYLIFDC